MPRSFGVRKEATYWWNGEIAELRAKTICARRKVTRYKNNRNDPDFKKIHKEYKQIVKEYKRLIWSAKKASWKELLNDLDKDPCGMAFKIVTKKTIPGGPIGL
jgi:preprotein translocase subunit Sss1